ncbi:SDR family oxidoreductase [Actinophytocola sp.]|uniref:SDR family oxidoreductase n=1 Tax=Actinophytocola sp. TaxID=1872138 RepID=UPI002ED09976
MTARPTLLLTGGSGVLGQALIDELSGDFDLVCLSHRTPVEDPRVRTITGALTEPGRLRDLVGKVDVVLHSAAVTSWRASRERILETNVTGTRHMLDLARRAGARFYYVSTAFVARPPAADPDDPDVAGLVAYVHSKIAAEELVRAAGPGHVILRPPVVIGDTDTGRIAKFQGIHQMFGALVQNAVPLIPADPTSLIDVLPQDVVARAIGRLVRAEITEGEYWLTAGGAAPTVADLVDITVSVGERLGHAVHRPRMLPAEAVDRLLIPLMEDVLPPELRRRFGSFVQLMTLFQSERALPTSLPAIGLDVTMSHRGLLAAFRRSVEYWAVRTGLATDEHFESEAVA